MTVDISHALTIHGYMSTAELTWLAEQAQTHSNIIEIGCNRGRSTRALVDNAATPVWTVDIFLADDLKDFQRTMLGVTNIMPLATSSLNAATVFAWLGIGFDMIFIDADHAYESVKADILAWKRLLAPGGLLCGHDYGGNFQGVTQAVDELVKRVKLGPGSIWYTEEI